MPKSKKSKARLFCEAFISEYGVYTFDSMVSELKYIYHELRAKSIPAPECIQRSAASYQSSHQTPLNESELKKVLGHVLNVKIWWREPKRQRIVVGERRGQQQLF
jgi:hypothetical protein